MTKEQILKKAIEKAIKNGYKPDGLLGGVLRGEIGVGLNPNIYHHLVDVDNQYYIHIFPHDFAKAFWGERKYKRCKYHKKVGEVCNHCKLLNVGWEHYITEMVLSEEPLKYLEKFL